MWSYYEGWAKQVIQETRYKFRQGELESLFEQGYTINDALDWAEEAQDWLDDEEINGYEKED
jgi:hypothetical protein